jgi:hypothetical protein
MATSGNWDGVLRLPSLDPLQRAFPETVKFNSFVYILWFPNFFRSDQKKDPKETIQKLKNFIWADNLYRVSVSGEKRPPIWPNLSKKPYFKA